MPDSGNMSDAHRHSAPPDPDPAWAFFLDVDGTLLEFAATPMEVHIQPDVQALIRRFYQTAGGAVALISGRRVADIDRLFGSNASPVAGQHGIERRDATGRLHHHAPSNNLAAIRASVETLVASMPGILLEDKGASIALHYRRAPHLAPRLRRALRELVAAAGADIALQPGKMVLEVKPAGRDKGIAIREFMAEAPFRGRTPAFVGDDATDEYGFALVNELGGHSIKVGRGASIAGWRLRDVKAVRAWLGRCKPARQDDAAAGAVRT